MMIADSHNHLHFDSFENDLSHVVSRAASAGVRSMLLVGIDPSDSMRALEVASSYEGMFVSIGIHPQNAGVFNPEDVLALGGLGRRDKIVAVGETGFDLYRTPESEQLQKKLFEAHISLARKLSLPIVIHDRDAHRQTLEVLDEQEGWLLGGVFHCYSGDREMASYILDRGFYISVPGVVTYKKSSILKEVVSYCPLESILVETDAPFLSPEPYRGKRNEPSYLLKTLDVMAMLKGISAEEMARITFENFSRAFCI